MNALEKMVGIPNILINESFPNNSPQDALSSNIPSGYTLPHLIVFAVFFSTIMIIIVFGNLLVVVAIATDKQLKAIQNWFIASLAVADLSLGLVIMPFSLANELMRYWYFGPIWCDLWKAIDVLLCTASILSICLISLDRYWSITHAIEYSRQRTPTRAALMITAVWVLSGIVCVPPLIGWKNPLPVSEYPLCLLSSEIGYVISSCMGSFYIPAVIMVFVYFKIYQAAKARARRGRRHNNNLRINEADSRRPSKQTMIPTKELTSHSDEVEKRSMVSDDESTWPVYKKHSTSPPVAVGDENTLLLQCNKSGKQTTHLTITNAPQQIDTCGHEVVMEQKCLLQKPVSIRITYIHSDDNNRTDDSCYMSMSSNNEEDNPPKITKCDITVQCPEISVNQSISDIPDLTQIERQKRKLAKARERRATIVLGLVMAAFILCWFPFFTIYIIKSLCNKCVPEILFTITFWAGYCNSALNPIIYTIFNQDFRKAFRKIIFRNFFMKR